MKMHRGKSLSEEKEEVKPLKAKVRKASVYSNAEAKNLRVMK